MKLYLQAPLPFMGQKRFFAKKYISILRYFRDATTFVDLFGGSGLLSHITKHERPDATVIYNDYDNYRRRLANIPQTNALLASIRTITGGERNHKRLSNGAKERILQLIEQADKRGFVDYITLSASLLFSMNYVKTLDELRREPFYNCVRATDYPLCDDYLAGLTITSADYKEVFREYENTPGVVFLADPPYLATDTAHYNMAWDIGDYLDVLHCLDGHPFVYFTSQKSQIVEFCKWIERNPRAGNPFKNAHREEFRAHVNYNAAYTDIMLFKHK